MRRNIKRRKDCKRAMKPMHDLFLFLDRYTEKRDTEKTRRKEEKKKTDGMKMHSWIKG